MKVDGGDFKKKRRPRGIPEPSSEEARRRMEAQGQRDTDAELKIRSILHRMGFRYRVDHGPLREVRRKADLAFIGPRVAVFVDGCFWHGCPIHGTWPKANAEFWRTKIEANRRRDADTDQRLQEAGWKVIRIWQHDNPEEATRKIARLVRSRSRTKRARR